VLLPKLIEAIVVDEEVVLRGLTLFRRLLASVYALGWAITVVLLLRR